MSALNFFSSPVSMNALNQTTRVRQQATAAVTAAALLLLLPPHVC